MECDRARASTGFLAVNVNCEILHHCNVTDSTVNAEEEISNPEDPRAISVPVVKTEDSEDPWFFITFTDDHTSTLSRCAQGTALGRSRAGISSLISAGRSYYI